MLVIKNLKKTYKTAQVEALKGINLELGNKGFIVLLGKSGSGKSTLLNILGGLDRFDEGEIIIKGKSTKDFKANEWDSYRNTYVGFVFQEFYIIDEFSVGKNIRLALELQGFNSDTIDSRVDEILKQVDLEGYKDRRPNEISGGQKQRIAIARALVKDPQIILADEPTGNLDSETGRLILSTLKKLSEEKLVIMVTHDADFAHVYGDRIIELSDGEIIRDSFDTTNDKIFEVNDQIKKIIKLSKGSRLSKDSIDSINELLKKGDDDVFLTFSEDVNYIKTFVPMIDQTVKEEIKIDKHKFYKEDHELFQLKKTSLPFSYALKLSISSLFKKKFRLTLMTILFIFALIFVGMSANFMFYDVDKVANLTFKKADVNLPLHKEGEVVCSGDYCRYLQGEFSEEDINLLKTEYKKMGFLTHYDRFIPLSDLTVVKKIEDNRPYYKNSFTSISIIDQSKAYFPILLGDYPNMNEVLVTDYMAEMFIRFTNVKTFEELIGKELSYNGHQVKISGIVRTNIKSFDDIKNSYNENEFVKRGFYYSLWDYRRLIMTRETYESSFKKPTASFGFFLKETDEYPSHFGAVAYTLQDKEYLIGESKLPLNDDEIVLSLNILRVMFSEDFDPSIELEDMVKEYLNRTIHVKHQVYNRSKDQWSNEEKDYKIVGVITRETYGLPYDIMFSNNEFDRLIERTHQEDKLLVSGVLGDDDHENIRFLKDLKDLNIRHESRYSNMLYTLNEIIRLLKNVPIILGAIFTSFASLMIFTFISSSINNKKKEIGTLRAMGARGIDVSKIFITEGFIIALFSSVLANIGMSIIISLINKEITASYRVPLVLLYVNVTSILIIFALSFLVVFLASFIPIKRITLMKPINAIKNLK